MHRCKDFYGEMQRDSAVRDVKVMVSRKLNGGLSPSTVALEFALGVSVINFAARLTLSRDFCHSIRRICATGDLILSCEADSTFSDDKSP